MCAPTRAAISWRRFLGCGFAALALQAQAAEPSLSYERALQLAGEESALLKARRAATEGAAALQSSASQLPDPRLTAGIDNLPVTGSDRYSIARDFMTMRQIGWMQDMPNADKRKARSDVAAARTARERAQLAAERVLVERETAQAWLVRYHAEQRLAAFKALETENRLLRDTVNARIASGKAMPADATMARQEALSLEDRRDELERDVAKARAALHRWVGQAGDLPLAGEPPMLPVHHEHLREQLHRHAELSVYGPMADIARAEGREIETGKRGDWSWGVVYSKRGSAFSDMVSLQLSFELPLWASRRQDPQLAARQKEVERIQAEHDDARRRIVAEIDAHLAEDAELSRKLARLNERALPLAQERVSLTLASYEAGRGDLGAVLASRKELIETRLRAIELAAQRAISRVRLNTLLVKEQS